ncbi:hypothetical protein F53441_2984 [Fusarium austroafricanum]|uniref:Uncharacterized protein n=1 Tax=Fusarium austroafricanum TaxID=2364996 RepID=A0A8H4KNC5_9HYPO|nr:hypothetical protein F53441_2984 [Fusarium austroafricanum]
MSDEDISHPFSILNSLNFDQHIGEVMFGPDGSDGMSINNFIDPENLVPELESMDFFSDSFDTEFENDPQSSAVPSPAPEWSEDLQILRKYVNGNTGMGQPLIQGSASTVLASATQAPGIATSEPFQVPELHQAQIFQPLDGQPILQPMQPFQQQLVQYQGYQQQLGHYPASQSWPTQYQCQLIQSQPTQTQHPQPQPRSEPHPQVPIPTSPSDTILPDPKRHKSPKPFRAENKLEEWVISKLNDHTYQYQGYVTNWEQARFIEGAYLSLVRHEAQVTSPESDVTFPKTDQEYCDRVHELFDAMCDWTDLYGWRAKMGTCLAKQWIAEVKAYREENGLSTEPRDMRDEIITPPDYRMPDLKDQWQNVVHRHMSDVEIEILCCKILDQAMLSQQDINFIPLWSNNECQWEEFDSFGELAEALRKSSNKTGNDNKRNALQQNKLHNGGNRKRARSEESDGQDGQDGQRSKRART